jgi:CRP-like cAMP-binding protein
MLRAMTQPADVDRLQALQRIPLLSGLPYGELERMAGKVEAHSYKPGTELIREGTSGSSVFFIVSGRCEVRRRVGNSSVRLALLEPGDFFGELSIVDPAPRTATVTAYDEVSALVLSGYEFQAALQSSRSMAHQLVKTLAQRLRALEDEFAPRVRP